MFGTISAHKRVGIAASGLMTRERQRVAVAHVNAQVFKMDYISGTNTET